MRGKVDRIKTECRTECLSRSYPSLEKRVYLKKKIKEAPAPISGPFLQSGKAKNLKFSDIGAGRYHARL